MSKYTRGLLSVILAVVLVLPAAAFAMLPEANAGSSTGMDGPAATKTVDPDTTSRWQYWASGGEQDQTTRYVGRIWTDKTVEPAEDEKSDFVTTLSTISSTSDTTSLVTKPLDIVLVLDASGSMSDDMGERSTTRINALKSAANSFIDTIAEQNKSINDKNKWHQVAIVKFAGNKRNNTIGNDTYRDRQGYTHNYSQVMKGLTPCVDSTATELKNTVGFIEPAGATQADYGLELARDMSGRADAQKVVVFFTDGSPTSSNGFESGVANDAVNAAKTMKDKGATIYTIGIFSGANPDQAISKASKENRFMHAVSSNYPNATSYKTNELGQRTENSDFYKAASNADELNQVFKDISASITEDKSYPTQVEDGYDPSKSGYITFSDELGDFMQVDEFISAQINGETIDKVTKTTKGNVDTYEFLGIAKDLVITVARSDNAQQGDIVTVKIPASLIPLINYHVDMEKGIFEHTSLNDIKPIQVKYTSSVKDDARNSLFTPDKELEEHIDTHKGTDNQTVYFLANKWSGGELGDVVAEFEPSDTNSYYYFQKITPIYTDEACTQRTTVKPQGSGVYYYKDEFVAMGEDLKPKNDYAVVMFEGHEIANYDGALVKEDGYWSFNKGTARLAYIDQLHTTKADVGGNMTETARDVLNPRWNDLSSVATSTHVHSHLGNNGKIIFSLATKPTTVDTKTDFGLTKVLEGRKRADTDAFEFELSATSDNNAPMPDPATVTVTNADFDKGKAAINFGKITYAEPGEYTYEVREVKGDAGGITYSKNVATFKVTVTVNAKGELKADVEKTSGETKFTNTYSAKTETPLTLEATKTLTGRLMADGEFKFTLSYAGHDEVLLNATNKGGKVEFGPLTYTTESLAKLVEEEKASFDDSSDKPTWTIRYTAAEQTGKLPAGVSAAVSAIDAYVTVVDNGDGTLTATADYGDAGNEFVNAYTAAPAEASLVGKKNLQVPDGLTPADITGKFTFTVTGEEGAPMPANASVTNDAKGKVDFGKITFTLDDLNKALGEKPEKREHTFTYTVTESGEVAGVTNDANATRKVSYTVTDDGKGNLSVSHKPDGDVAFTFTNAYNVKPVEDRITATKVLTGRDMTEGEFSFELVEGEGKDAKVVATGKNAADGTITMSPVKYDKAGTHTYTLREVNGGTTSKGVTYSDAKFTIVTTITDNGDGTLSATHVLKDVKVAEFKNSYNVTPKSSSVTDLITADKVLDGRDLKAGEFRFELVEGNNVVATGTNNADGKIVMDPVTYTAAGEHTYILRETKAGTTENGITYSTAEYTIVTTVKDNNDGTLSVEHKLQNVDKATFENAYTVTPKSFSVTDQITATKVLTGRDLKEGEFSFELVEGNDVVATGKNDARGKIKMSPIEYTAAGEHTYTLREVKGDAGNGITYDGKTYTIETTITDKGDGTLEAKHVLKGDGEAKFSNSYKPNPGEFSVTDQITATKSLTGRDLKDGEFSFELVEGEDEDAKVVATGTNAADGKITMNAVKYTEAGKHAYTLREIKGGTTSKGITYSDAKYTIETTITDNGDGTLKAEHVLKDATAATFKNTYSVAPLDAELDFDLGKVISGRDWTDGDEFSFTITAPEDAPLPDPATVTVSKKDAKDGIAAIKFGKIHYAAAGTYKYEIRENAGSTVGLTYDAHVATAEVTVTENGDGSLTANVTKKENGRFTNTYRTELNYTAAGGLWLSKYLDGRPMTEGQFTFTVTPADDASARALGLLPGANSFKSPAAAEATVGLIDILAGHEVIFTQADAGKTFTYTVAEKNDGQPGYTYDDAVRTVTIAIADDTAGTLTATTTVSGGPEGTHETVHKSGENKVEKALVPFHNSYSATTNTPGGTAAQVVATKTLTGRPMADGEFWFGIAYQGELVAYENLKPNIGGHVSFDTLHYDTKMLANLEAAGLAYRTDKDGKLAWTINYTAYEDLFGLPNGVSATTWSFGFKVIVVDNGDGTLTATVDYGGVEPLFENVYGADAVDAALTGTKKLQVAEGLTPADITGKFTFTVTADEAGAPMPERTTVTNDAAGNVDFGKIHFTLEDLNRALGVTDDATDKAEADEADEAEADEAEAEEADPAADANVDESEPAAPTAPRSHTFAYTVTETGSAPGVTNDANATRKVSYTVTDDGAGHLSVKREGDDGAAFTFTNTYSVTPTDSSVTDQVKTVKRLTGRDLAVGEFAFDLLEDDVVVASGTNDANGTVTLSPIRYEAPGTHTYTLREACPNALGLYKGVTYDGTTYTVVTTVSDNGDGTLTATHKLEGTTESAGFTNKYHAMPTQVSIGAIKVLEGRELKKDEFSFKLVGEDIESTVANDADGKISFDKFEYDEPGTHVYTISEVKGDEVGMTYDRSVFTVTVNVVDDGEGNLRANVAFTKGDKSVEGIVFNNTYKKPETPVPTPDPGTPKTVTNIVKTVKGFLPTTGDQQAAALLMTFVIAMAGVGALVWGIRKR